jgi:hypothetical protein
MDGAGQHYHAIGYPSQVSGPAVQANRYSVVNEDMEDAYGGVADGLDDHKGEGPGDPEMDADMESVHSGHSQEEPRRVLKVANE